MTSIANPCTSITPDCYDFGKTSPLPASSKVYVWEVEKREPREGLTLALGDKLIAVLSLLSFLSLAFLVYSFYKKIPYFTPKYSFFLFILFGGMTLELLWTKKLNKEQK